MGIVKQFVYMPLAACRYHGSGPHMIAFPWIPGVRMHIATEELFLKSYFNRFPFECNPSEKSLDSNKLPRA
jgi:hypothetical protein